MGVGAIEKLTTSAGTVKSILWTTMGIRIPQNQLIPYTDAIADRPFCAETSTCTVIRCHPEKYALTLRHDPTWSIICPAKV